MTFAIKKIKANKRVVGAIVGFPTIVGKHSGLQIAFALACKFCGAWLCKTVLPEGVFSRPRHFNFMGIMD